MNTKSLRKLSFFNLDSFFPTSLCLFLSYHFYNSALDFNAITNTFALLFFIIGVLGLCIILFLISTKITINTKKIVEDAIVYKKELLFEKVQTFEVYEISRWGSKHIDKNELYKFNSNFKSERIILISTLMNKRPNSWWKFDKETISIPFQFDTYKLIEHNLTL
jgi:hypothetical protein